MVTLSKEELDLLEEHLLEWHLEVHSGGDCTNFCPECGWDSARDAKQHVHGLAVLKHKPDCKWAALLQRLREGT